MYIVLVHQFSDRINKANIVRTSASYKLAFIHRLRSCTAWVQSSARG